MSLKADAVQQPNSHGGISSVVLVRASGRSIPRAPADHCVEQYPTDLLSDRSSAEQGDGARTASWWLGHARPRQEKAVASDLFARRIPYYLPLVARKSITRGRTRHVRLPLFPGYVFICGSEADRLRALKTNRLLTIQQVPDGNCLRRQLMSLAKLIAAGAPLVRESRLAAGERVRIKTGLFRGIEGVILRRHGKTELLIAIDFLGQGVSIEIEDCGAEPV